MWIPLVGPDGDPHTFEPSPKDSALLSKADVVVVNGLGLEGWLDRLIKASGFKGELVVASKGVKTHTLDEEGKTVTDPHALEQRSERRIVCAEYPRWSGESRPGR